MTLLGDIAPRITLKITNAYLPGPPGPGGGGGGSSIDIGLPLSLFASGGVVTTSNFETALNSAIVAMIATSGGAGNTILIPPGKWPMTSTLNLRSLGFTGRTRIVGAGKDVCTMYWPAGWSLPCIDIDGTLAYGGGPAPGGAAHGLFDIKGLSLGFLAPNGNNPTVIRAKNILSSSFEDLSLFYAYGTSGYGFRITNSTEVCQNLVFREVDFGLCYTGMETSDINTTAFYDCRWNNCQFNNLVMFRSQASFYGQCMWQGTSRYGIQVPQGSCSINVFGGYTESCNLGFVYYRDGNASPVSGHICIDGLTVVGNVDPVIDADGSQNGFSADFLDVRNLKFIGSETRIAVAKAMLALTTSGIAGPVDAPGRYVLDSYTLARTTSSFRGRVRSGGQSSAQTIAGMLAPYSAEVIDPSRKSTLSLSGTDVLSITGANGTVFSNTGTGTFPQYIASSTDFNGQAAFRTISGQRFLRGVLASPVAVTTGRPGVFIVWRRTAALGCTPFWLRATTGTGLPAAGDGLLVGSDDGGATSNWFSQWYSLAGNNYDLRPGVAIGNFAHSQFVQSQATEFPTDVGRQWVDARAPVAGSLAFAGGPSANLAAIDLYANNGGTASTGTYDIALVVIMRASVPTGIVEQVMDLSGSLYAV